MKYGYFDDNKKEYVITNPKTPYPWINYLGNEDFFTIISNTAGGYSFFKDPKQRRITRFRYNNVPIDSEGKYFYIHDGQAFWNIGYKPTKTNLDLYECHHGLGYTEIVSKKNNVLTKQLVFVPIGKPAEVHVVSVKNESDQIKELDVYSYLEWAFWDALDDMTNFQRNYNIPEVEVENNTIYHKTEYRERRNHYAFYYTSEDMVGFDTDREAFIGLYNDLREPDVLETNVSKNSVCTSFAAIASHHIQLKLQPNEEKKVIFILGYVENDVNDKFVRDNIINKDKANKIINSLNSLKKIDARFNELKLYWHETLSKFQVESEDENLNRMVNVWNQYQNVTCYNFSRSASYFESGVSRGMGFRDSNQDLLGFIHLEPEKSRQRILDLASTMFENGGAYHQFSTLTKRGNTNLGNGFNDDPCWMVLSAVKYIKETADYSILDEVIPYGNADDSFGTMLEHMDRAFHYTLNHIGPHGLPLIGRADWNDCLNLNCFSSEPGESFQTVKNLGDGLVAESVFIAGLFVYAGKEYLQLLEQLDLSEKVVEVKKYLSLVEKAVVDYGYDGEWYLRAYDAFGEKIGSHKNKEGKIYIEPQGMCSMAGIGHDQSLDIKALHSARKYLETEYGMVLNYPAYKQYDIRLGEISSYPPGLKENGGIFCHNNTWMICALAKVRESDFAYELYKKITPAYLENISDIHRTEPYAYCQMVAGKESVRHGEGKNSWLTGTSSWSFVAVSQYILGVQPDFNGLRLEPSIPTSWTNVTIKRTFRDVEYQIKMIRAENKKGVYLNSKKIRGQIVPYDPSIEKQDVIVYI